LNTIYPFPPQFPHDCDSFFYAVKLLLRQAVSYLTLSAITAEERRVAADPACEQAGPPTAAGVRPEGHRGWRRRRAAVCARAGRGRIPSRSRWGGPPRRGSR